MQKLLIGLIFSLGFVNVSYAQETRPPFVQFGVTPAECYQSRAFAPPPQRIGFDHDPCMYRWYIHSSDSGYTADFIVAHLTVNDTVDNVHRKMRIDLVIRNGERFIVARRYCRWDTKGAGTYTPKFELSLPVYGEEVDFLNCGDRERFSRENMIKAILARTSDARGREPWAVRSFLNPLRQELR